jgi:FMN-dependent NADH-azoreductase
MKNVLVVKANNRPDGISAKMFDTFVENLDKSAVELVTFDVYAQPMPYIGQTLFEAFGKLAQEQELNQEEQELMTVRQDVMNKFAAADTIVFAFPMWNLTIPAALHTFIDYIFQAGFTFSYNEDGSMNQLMKDKEVVLLNARGGVYSGEMSGMESAVTFMEKVFGGMFGMTISDEVIIEGHNADPSKTDEIIAEGLEKVTAAAKKF